MPVRATVRRQFAQVRGRRHRGRRRAKLNRRPVVCRTRRDRVHNRRAGISGRSAAEHKLVWFDRTGRQTGTLTVPEGRYQDIAIAPDGRRASITRFTTQSDSDLWIADLTKGGATRFTTERALNVDAVWSPDSTRIVFASDVAGPRNLFVKPASGATLEQAFYASAALFKDSRAWSPDSKFVMFEQLDPKTNRDLMMLSADGSAGAKPGPYLQRRTTRPPGLFTRRQVGGLHLG